VQRRAREEGLRKAGIPLEQCVEISGLEHGCGDLWNDAEDLTVLDTAKADASLLHEAFARGLPPAVEDVKPTISKDAPAQIISKPKSKLILSH